MQVALCLYLGSGCSALPDLDPGDAPEAAAPRSHAAVARAAPPDLVAWTASGELAVVDGASGAVRQKLPPPLGGSGERDVAWDRWARRVLVYQGDEGGEGGEIVSHPLIPLRDGWRLGVRAHQAWVDGRLRLLPVPAGTVVFEQSYGERWRLLGAQPTPSVTAPPPTSVWLEVRPAAAVVHALTMGPADPTPTRRAAVVSAAGLASPSVQPLPADPDLPPPSSSARLVPAPALGDAVLVDLVDACLVVRLLDGAGGASIVPLPTASERLDAAVPLQGGAVLAILTSGASGVTAVTALAVDSSGLVWSVAHLALPGDVAPDSGFFSRDLAVQGPQRVLAATSAGVHALRVAGGADVGVSLALAPGFTGSSLRGPLAVIDLSP